MHVLVLPSYYAVPENPQQGVFFREQAKALCRYGCKVGVLWYEAADLKRFSLSRFGDNHFQIVETCRDGMIEMSMRGWSTHVSSDKGLALWVWLNKKLFREYIRRHGRPDIIHAHVFFNAGYLAGKLYEEWGIPYVVTEHSSSVMEREFTVRERRMITEGAASASVVIAVSQALASRLRPAVPGKRVEVLPNFIDTGFFDIPVLAEQRTGFRFFSLGYLIPRKGFSLLIDAFAAAFASDNSVELSIGGIGEQKSFLQDKIDRYGLTGRIRLLGGLDREQVRYYMQNSDAFVLASRAETFGVVYAEAMACGKPVIATDCGPVRELFDERQGIVVPVDDKEALKNAMLAFRKGTRLFDSQQIKAYTREKFGMEHLSEKLVNIYKSAL